MEAQMKINQKTYKIKEIIAHAIMSDAIFLHTNCMKNITKKNKNKIQIIDSRCLYLAHNN